MKIGEILEQFEEYLESDEAKKHLKTMEQEKREVKELMKKLEKMDKNSDEFTDLVLYGLLPYNKTKHAKRVSLFPAFMNIKLFFKRYAYSEKEWNIVANKIYKLCFDFTKNPDKLFEYIQEFTKDKYSKNLQCGSITPILYSLNDLFPIVNNRTIRAYNNLTTILNKKDKIHRNLDDYMDNIQKLKNLVTQLNLKSLENNDYLDLLCYWYDSEILSGEQKNRKKEIEEDLDETEDVIKENQVIISNFLQKINLNELSSFQAHSLGDPQRIKINQIIQKTATASWVLPHFQRYFDWTKKHVKDFLESIFNDYYVGSFLLWDIDRNPELEIQTVKGVIKNKEDIIPNSIILDGQQRLTSLFYAIRAPDFSLKGSKSRTFFYLNFNKFFDKTSKDELIKTYTKKLSKIDSFNHMLFPFFELEHYSNWVDGFEDYLLSETNNQNQEEIRKIRRIVDKKLRHIWEGFEIPYIALPETMMLYQVTDIFENINTKGKPLNVFDLLIARLYKYDIELKKIWNSTRNTHKDIYRYYHNNIAKIPIYILQTLSLLYKKNSSCKRADILDIYSNIYQSSDRIFDEDWEDISDYMDKSIKKFENMRDGFGVKDKKQIPSDSMIPVLTALLKEIDQRKDKSKCYIKLKKWYWASVFTLSYSSAADSQMTIDFKQMRKWFDNDSELPEVIIRLNKELDIIDFKKIHSKRGARYRGIMALFALEGAKDFDTLQTLENSRKNEDHHIFPNKSSLKIKSKYIDSVLNKTWLSDKTNKSINNKLPSRYIKEYISNSQDDFLTILNTHLISEKALNYLLEDNFEGFINEREKEIISKIKQIMGFEISDKTKNLISPNTPFTNNLIFQNMIKSCDSYIFWLDKYFSQKGLELISENISDNIRKIKIINSIDKIDEKFRKNFKAFKEELQNKNITCELRVIIDSKLKSSIHDRFILSKYKSYNIPSPDTIARGQLSEISESQNKDSLEKEFQSIWKQSKDIVKDWDVIQKNKQ